VKKKIEQGNSKEGKKVDQVRKIGKKKGGKGKRKVRFNGGTNAQKKKTYCREEKSKGERLSKKNSLPGLEKWGRKNDPHWHPSWCTGRKVGVRRTGKKGIDRKQVFNKGGAWVTPSELYRKESQGGGGGVKQKRREGTLPGGKRS